MPARRSARTTIAALCHPTAWRGAGLLLACATLSTALAQDAPAPPSPDSRNAPPAVVAARLDSVWLQPAREAPASVVARNQARLSAETGGVLLRWTRDVGARVKRGELLAQIDPRDAELNLQRARAALDAAQARLQLAQQQLERARELVAKGFFSREAQAQRETEVALLQSEVSSGRAQFDIAQRQLAKTTLRAPFDGSITQRLAQTGEAVAPGSVLFVLTESDASEVAATLSPADLPGLRQAGELRFETAAGSHALRLLRVAATLDAPARTQAVRLAFERSSATTPLPGTSGSLQWVERAPHIPPDLLLRRGGVLGVFVVEGSGTAAKARFSAVADAQEGRASRLPDRLGAATLVIVRGQAALQDGQAITVQTR